MTAALRNVHHLERQIRRIQEEAYRTEDSQRKRELEVALRFYERQLRAAQWKRWR